jgi:hypothetical protein
VSYPRDFTSSVGWMRGDRLLTPWENLFQVLACNGVVQGLPAKEHSG